MALKIEGINSQLLSYKIELDRKTPFTDRVVSKIIDAKERLDEIDEEETLRAKAESGLLFVKALGLGFMGIAAESIETKKRRKELMERTGYSSDEVAADINELIEKGNAGHKVKVYGEDIRYSAMINKAWLTKLNTIFGNAHLEALRDLSCVSALESVWGDLHFAQSEDIDVDLSPLSIKMVYGNIHAERAISAKGLENLLFVGGKIYYQGNEYTLEQFQNEVLKDEPIKEIK